MGSGTWKKFERPHLWTWNMFLLPGLGRDLKFQSLALDIFMTWKEGTNSRMELVLKLEYGVFYLRLSFHRFTLESFREYFYSHTNEILSEFFSLHYIRCTCSLSRLLPLEVVFFILLLKIHSVSNSVITSTTEALPKKSFRVQILNCHWRQPWNNSWNFVEQFSLSYQQIFPLLKTLPLLHCSSLVGTKSLRKCEEKLQSWKGQGGESGDIVDTPSTSQLK